MISNDININNVKHYYVDLKYSIENTAKALSCSSWKMNKILEEHNLKRTNSQAQIVSKNNTIPSKELI